MKNIGWIQISSKKYGGATYNEEARKALSKIFNIELVLREPKIFKGVKYLRIPESLLLLMELKGEKDLWIRDFYSTVTLNKKKIKGKNLVMIHHIDPFSFPLFSWPFFLLLERIFYRNLRKTDFIVTVSKYWQNHFLRKGYKNVYKIYNSFNLEDYNISEQEVENFKKEKNLLQKPIIYLGNCQKAKGVIEAYNTLRGLNAHLITSGEREVKIPALNLNLDYREYLILLKASTIVLAMSKMKEGWCRKAHEAMLMEVPVIGSGKGGMKELLEGGKQIICPDFKKLKNKVEYLLNNPEERKKIGKTGFDFAKNFTLERFHKEWQDLITKILK
jgi:glycosyltransferase involved in cell wall biosynthesis